MTEKRYKMKCHEINSWHIEKDGKVLIFDLFKSDAEIIYNELNKLSDENEQLKKEKEEIKSKAESFVELYEKDFGKNYYTPPRSGKTVRPQLWIVRKILDEIGILELYGDVE